jgi:hypothetical protein
METSVLVSFSPLSSEAINKREEEEEEEEKSSKKIHIPNHLPLGLWRHLCSPPLWDSSSS